MRVRGMRVPGRDYQQQVPSGFRFAAFVGLGRDFGMRTVAEGVETAEQLQLVGHFGIDEVQGFLLSRLGPTSNLTE